MADDRTDNPHDTGRHSPAGESGKQPRMSGDAAGSGEGKESAGPEEQAPQTSGTGAPADEHEETVQKGYDAAQEPEQQGDGDPRPRAPQQPS
jgi:hypothetical protein